MKFKLKTESSCEIKNDIVAFKLSFHTVRNTLDNAVSVIAQDLAEIKRGLQEMGITETNFELSPIYASANMVSVEETKGGSTKRGYKQQGYYADSAIYVTLPLSWADGNNTFGAIYSLFESSGTHQRFEYSFTCFDIEKYKADLRTKLLQDAYSQVKQMTSFTVSSQPVLEEVFYNCDAQCSMQSAYYADSYDDGADRVFTAKPASNSVSNTVTSAKLIDLLVTAEAAPSFIIRDSVTSIWSIETVRFDMLNK